MTDMEPVKEMPVREFVERGFLQEVNRNCLHPCGLAIEATRFREPATFLPLSAKGVESLRALIAAARSASLQSEDALNELADRLANAPRYADGDMVIMRVWDYREDPEGIIFDDGGSAAKANEAQAEWDAHKAKRIEMFGSAIQPIGHGNA